MGWVREYEQIKSVLWVPGTGQNGFNGLGEILMGTINPSGKAADTFVAALLIAFELLVVRKGYARRKTSVE